MDIGQVVALWYVGERTAEDIVRTACDLLVAGEGGPAMAELAAVPYRNADEEVPALLAAALAEVNHVHHERGTRAADLAGFRAMAALVANDELDPEGFAHWAYVTFGEEGLAEARPLLKLSDEYEMRTAMDAPAEDVDEQVVAEVRRLLGSV